MLVLLMIKISAKVKKITTVSLFKCSVLEQTGYECMIEMCLRL